MATKPATLKIKDQEGKDALLNMVQTIAILDQHFTQLMKQYATRNTEFAELLTSITEKNKNLKEKSMNGQPILENELTELTAELEKAYQWLQDDKLSTPLLDAQKKSPEQLRQLRNAFIGEIKKKNPESGSKSNQLSEAEQQDLARHFQQHISSLHQNSIILREHSKIDKPNLLERFIKAIINFVKLCFDKLANLFRSKKDVKATATPKPVDDPRIENLAACAPEAAQKRKEMLLKRQQGSQAPSGAHSNEESQETSARKTPPARPPRRT